jgi:toxin ParE1/3/4
LPKSALPSLEWKATASADLLAIVDYISNDNPDAAQALMDEIEAKTARLPGNRQLYRAGRVEGAREMVVLPSYSVIYSETALAVTILRVLHTARL